MAVPIIVAAVIAMPLDASGYIGLLCFVATPHLRCCALPQSWQHKPFFSSDLQGAICSRVDLGR
jgi:hypothetical protein